MGFLKIKTFIQLHIDSNMRIVMEGKLRLYTNCKVYSFLVISDVNKTVRYISFIMFIARNAFALHEMISHADLLLKGIFVSTSSRKTR